jgi:hypothetical protein
MPESASETLDREAAVDTSDRLGSPAWHMSSMHPDAVAWRGGPPAQTSLSVAWTPRAFRSTSSGSG